jgi:hypothetical protein
MFKKIISIFIVLTLCWTTVACGSSTSTSTSSQPTQTNTASIKPSNLPNGTYPVQQASYNDVDGVYTLMLLNASPPVYQSSDLQMARLTDEAIANGQKTSLEINGNQAVMYLTEDFKIEYVHNVTENQVNPQSGQTETVIVRRESSFWTPFAGALAGQALGSLLFSPQYYVPPVYQSGLVLSGYGGYGSTYTQAINSYETKYKSPPPVKQNTQNLRTTGNLRTSATPTTSTGRQSPRATKASGSGYGRSNLQTSGQSSSKVGKQSPSFGSSARKRSSGFGSVGRSRSRRR